MLKTAVEKGFIKAATRNGFKESEAKFIFKRASQGIMDMFHQLQGQHPMATDAAVGALGGAGIGALSAGEGNRMKGALTGGALGGLGGAGVGLTQLSPEQRQQLLGVDANVAYNKYLQPGINAAQGKHVDPAFDPTNQGV